MVGSEGREAGSRKEQLAIALVIGSWLALAWTVAVVAAGGVDLRSLGLPVLARTPWPTAIVAAVLAVGAGVAMRGVPIAAMAAIGGTVARHATAIALALAVATAALSVRFGTFAAGGSDSYCYVEQAERWAAGTIRSPIEPGFAVPWRNAHLSLTPTGFVPSQSVEGAIAPICPAGLALAMALPRALGAPRGSVFCVVPLFAAVAVFAEFVLARSLTGALGGLAAAMLVATSPVFFYMAVQPMSDVPATAAWLVALACVTRGTRRALVGTGLAAGVAVLMRPNLAPLAGLLVVFAAGRQARTSAEGQVRASARDGLAVLTGLAPAAAGVGIVQWILYGSPLRSGYGNLDLLFRASHIVLNLLRYPRWLVETQSVFVLLGLVAPATIWWRERGRTGAEPRWPMALLLWAFALGAFLAYLPYVPFDGWWFLRFWLPGIPPLIVLAVAACTWVFPASDSAASARPPYPPQHPARSARAPHQSIALGVGLLVVGLAAWQLGVARERGAFDLQHLERKFVAAGEYVSRLPANAVVLTVWHSGAVRYYGSRPSILWDAIAPEELDRAVESLASQGREVFLDLEDWEADRFRSRFARHSAYAQLDWPPRARIGSNVSVWALADRVRFLRGEQTQSDRIWIR